MGSLVVQGVWDHLCTFIICRMFRVSEVLVSTYTACTVRSMWRQPIPSLLVV